MKHLITLFAICIIAINAGCQSGSIDVLRVPDPTHPGDSISCGLEGSAHDSQSRESHLAWIGNPKKNRYDIPDSSKVQTMKIEDFIAANADKDKFTEGTPVQVTAYVYNVMSGGVESCNCKTRDENFIDTHIELTPNDSDTDPQFRMIVEITPRLRQEMKQQGIDWSTATLKEKILHRIVTVQGWLFYDEVHEPEAFSTNSGNRPQPAEQVIHLTGVPPVGKYIPSLQLPSTE